MRNAKLSSIVMCAFLALPGIAQTSLERTVINVGATPGEPQDPPHPGVDMVAGPDRIRFDTWYAGVPRYWHQGGEPNGSATSIIYPNTGAAMTPVAVTGQDATFSTANGVDPNPVTRFDDPVGTAKYNYDVCVAIPVGVPAAGANNDNGDINPVAANCGAPAPPNNGMGITYNVYNCPVGCGACTTGTLTGTFWCSSVNATIYWDCTSNVL